MITTHKHDVLYRFHVVRLQEIMVRKKRVQRLDGRQRSVVENALHCANPPLPAAREVVVLPPMLEYIQRLLFKELNRTNTEKVFITKYQ